MNDLQNFSLIITKDETKLSISVDSVPNLLEAITLLGSTQLHSMDVYQEQALMQRAVVMISISVLSLYRKFFPRYRAVQFYLLGNHFLTNLASACIK